MKSCSFAFTFMQIDDNGNCYTCCPKYHSNYVFGNLFDNSFEEVWNSDKAIHFRERILQNDYSLCNQKKYCGSFIPYLDNAGLDARMPVGPKHIKFAHDHECNFACITCRKKIRENSLDTLTRLNARIESFFIPLCKNLTEATFSGNGDPFASRHYRRLIKSLATAYPNLLFSLHTNGYLCTKKAFEELGIKDRISSITVSINATQAGTYRKICRGGDFKILMDNLHFIKELYNTHKRGYFNFAFIVQYKNYKEMPAFARLAQSFGAQATFFPVYNWGSFKNTKSFDKINIADPHHPHFADFLSVLGDPELQMPYVSLNELKKLQNTTIIRSDPAPKGGG